MATVIDTVHRYNDKFWFTESRLLWWEQHAATDLVVFVNHVRNKYRSGTYHRCIPIQKIRLRMFQKKPCKTFHLSYNDTTELPGNIV